MCKTNDPPLTDKRSSLSCPGCDTLFHKKCARNLSKLNNGAFSVCCDDSAEKSILVPPSNNVDEEDLDLDGLPDSIQISKSDLEKIIQKAASKAAQETIHSFSATIDSINNNFRKLNSTSSQLKKNYDALVSKIQEAESIIKNSFETNCDLMYAEFSNRDFANKTLSSMNFLKLLNQI